MARAKREAHHVDEVEIAENVKENFKGDQAKQKQVFMFATTFNYLLEARVIDQDRLADDLRISSGSISNYRNGKCEPKLCSLIAIADYLGVDCHYLMTGVQQGNIKTARKTGLSDKAISNLQTWSKIAANTGKAGISMPKGNDWNKMQLDAINLLLESNPALLRSIYQYVYGQFDCFAVQLAGQDAEFTSPYMGIKDKDGSAINIEAKQLADIFLLQIQDGLRNLRNDKQKGGADSGVHKAKD